MSKHGATLIKVGLNGHPLRKPEITKPESTEDLTLWLDQYSKTTEVKPSWQWDGNGLIT